MLVGRGYYPTRIGNLSIISEVSLRYFEVKNCSSLSYV